MPVTLDQILRSTEGRLDSAAGPARQPGAGGRVCVRVPPSFGLHSGGTSRGDRRGQAPLALGGFDPGGPGPGGAGRPLRPARRRGDLGPDRRSLFSAARSRTSGPPPGGSRSRCCARISCWTRSRFWRRGRPGPRPYCSSCGRWAPGSEPLLRYSAAAGSGRPGRGPHRAGAGHRAGRRRSHHRGQQPRSRYLYDRHGLGLEDRRAEFRRRCIAVAESGMSGKAGCEAGRGCRG